MQRILSYIQTLNPRTLIVYICALFFIIVGSQICGFTSLQTDYEDVQTATVVEVLSTTVESWVDGMDNSTVTFTAKLTSGAQKGETVEMSQYIDSMYLPVADPVEKGDKILALETQAGSEPLQWSYAGVNRVGGLTKLCVLFALMILLVGGLKGGATIASLLLSIGGLFLVYIPSILSGFNIYLSTIVIAAYIIFVTLLLLNGFNTKTLCAIVGNLSGTLVAGLMALIVNAALGVTGVIDQDYVFLTMLEGDISIDLKAVVWAGILIGSLGAIMDVSMSIASSMQEISQEMQQKNMPRLVYAGLQIGKDMIGTMTNTLILAYVGGSLAVVLLFAAYNKNMMVIMNLEMIVVEIIQAVVGSMGILVAVPLTVFFCAWQYTYETPILPSIFPSTPVASAPQPDPAHSHAPQPKPQQPKPAPEKGPQPNPPHNKPPQSKGNPNKKKHPSRPAPQADELD